MILNGLVVLLVVGITLLWGMRGKGRGLFSSMLACACVIVSGAVAFALWEPLVYNVLLDLNEDMAWGLGLIIPFAVTLLITRLLADLLVPRNLAFGDVENFVGGAAFGLVSAIITAGILVLSLSFFRFGPALLGHQAVRGVKGGSLVYDKALWLPVDKLTVRFYEHLSQGAFSTPTPMATHVPRLYEQAAMQRLLYVDESPRGTYLARNSIKGTEFDVRGRYRVKGGARDLLTYETVDAQGQFKRLAQEVRYPDGGTPPPDSRIDGFVVEFRSGAGEKSGQVVVGPGQVRLVGASGGEPFAAHPFAIIAAPEAGSSRMHRFPLNASDLFIPSVGGASVSYFAFEFVVPRDVQPSALIVKNFRVPLEGDLDADPATSYASSEGRDQAVRAGELFPRFGIAVGGVSLADVDTSESISISPTGRGGFNEIAVGQLLPEGWVVATTTGTKGLETAEFDKDKYITGGRGQFTVEDLRQKGLDRKLRVERFASTRDTQVVQVRAKANGNATMLGRALESTSHDGPPRLLDEKGRVYDAIGWVYAESGTVNIRFTPDAPLKGLSELPSALTSSKRDQTLYLIFRPTKGVRIMAFLLGKKQIAVFSGGLEIR